MANWSRLDDLKNRLVSFSGGTVNEFVAVFTDEDFKAIEELIQEEPFNAFELAGEPTEYEEPEEYKLELVHSFMRIWVINNIINFNYISEDNEILLGLLGEYFN